MIRSLGFALPLVLAGTAAGSVPQPASGPAAGPGAIAAAPASALAAATLGMMQVSSISAFQMPGIAKPDVSSADCHAVATVRLDRSTPDVQNLCASSGRILVNGGNAQGFVLADVLTRGFGPVLRGTNVPDIRVERVTATAARADDVLGLGLVNVSDGIGHAVFRDLVWIGDTTAQAVNSDDAWGAITLKGKQADDAGTFEIRNFDFQNLWMKSGKYYSNVDGISTEAGYSGTISNGRVINASDACLDIKGKVEVDNVYLAGCREGMKIWTSQNHGLIQLGTNRFVGIIGKGTASATRTINIDVLIASGDPSVPLFRAEGGVVNLHIGRLVSKPEQVLNASSSFAGSRVTVDQRAYD